MWGLCLLNRYAHFCVSGSWRPEEGVHCPGSGVTDVVSHHVGSGTWTQIPEEQQVLLTPKHYCHFNTICSSEKQLTRKPPLISSEDHRPLHLISLHRAHLLELGSHQHGYEGERTSVTCVTDYVHIIVNKPWTNHGFPQSNIYKACFKQSVLRTTNSHCRCDN